MRIKQKYTIDASLLAFDLALQINKARVILDNYQTDKAMTEFGKGLMSGARQMIKCQVWNDRAFIPLIVRELKKVRVNFPKNKNSQKATDQA